MKDDQRVALTKRLLKEGLLRLLKTKDIGKINVTELCLESGINRATFYRHYQQPRDIIGEIRLNMFHDIKLFSERDPGGKNPAKWVEEMCQYCYDHADLLNILFRCRTDEEFVSLINELYREHFRDLRASGHCADLDDDEMKLFAYCFAGGVFYILRQWITEPIHKSPQEVAKVISRLLQNATQAPSA